MIPLVTKGDVAKAGIALGGAAGLVFFLSRTVAAKPSTEMTVTTEPPESVDVGVPLDFAGFIREADGPRLEGKEIWLIIDGERVDSTTSNSGGGWSFTITLEEEDSHTILAEFPGDEAHKGSAGWL